MSATATCPLGCPAPDKPEPTTKYRARHRKHNEPPCEGARVSCNLVARRHNDDTRKRKKALREAGKMPDNAHGASGWRLWGCRCDICVTERNAYVRLWRRKRGGRPGERARKAAEQRSARLQAGA